MTHAETDLDEDWQQHERFDPPLEMMDYFAWLVCVTRQEEARIRAEREDEPEQEPPF